MKKKNYSLKTVFVTLSIILGIFLLLLIVIPLLFKGKIKGKTLEVINQNLNARVSLDDINLSLFAHFPDATVSLKNLTIINSEPFEGDTLMHVQSFAITINLWDLFSDLNNPTVKFIDFQDGTIHLKVLKDGTANWDITKPDTAISDTSSSTPFTLKLQGYELKGINLHYMDRSMPMELHLTNINHKGEGNLSSSTFLLKTENDIHQATFIYDGTTYLNKTKIQGKMNLFADIDRNYYEFQENEVILNDLPISLHGSLTLYDTYYDLDLNTTIEKAPFSQLISLIPAVYWKNYEKIEFKGDFSFKASIKGIYSDSLYPNFEVSFQIQDGYMKYPDLPSPLEKIQLDLKVQNSDPHLKNLITQIQTCQFTLDQMPTSIQLEIRGTEHPFLKGTIKADLYLERILRVFPIQDYTVRGRLFSDITIDGQYNDNSFPKIKGVLELKNGYLKAAQYPNQLESITFKLTAMNNTGRLEDLFIDIPTFEFLLDKAPVKGSFHLKDAKRFAFEGSIDANIDLNALSHILNFQDFSLFGQLNLHLNAAGDLNTIEKGAYHQLQTKGQLIATNLEYKAPRQPELFIKETICQFSPSQISLSIKNGRYGASDFHFTGFVSNYWGYLLSQKLLQGSFSLISQTINLNQFLAEEGQKEVSTQPDSTVSIEAPSIPENLKLEFQASIANLIYKDYQIENFKGILSVENKQLILKDCRFSLLDANYQITGAYDAELPERPYFFASASVKNFDLQKGYRTFPILKKYVPVAQYTNGTVDMALELATPLNARLEPIYDQLNLKIISIVTKAEVKGLPLTQVLQKHLKTVALDPISLAQQKLQVEIKNGRLSLLEPVEFTHNGIRMRTTGSTYLNGNIDYTIEIELPAQNLSNALQSLTQTFGVASTAEKVILGFQAVGPFKRPAIKPSSFRIGGEKSETTPKPNLQQQFQESKEKIQQQVQETKEQVQQQVEQQVEEKKEEIQQQLEQKKEETKQQVEEKKEEVQQQLEEKKKELEEKVKGFGLPKFP